MSSRISRTAIGQDEIQRLIAGNCWGVLAMSDGADPYAVPVMYGYDGQRFVFINGPGHKLELLQANPRVCLVITEVIGQGREWRSVVVRGSVEWMEEPDREAAIDLLRRQMPFSAERLSNAAAVARAPIARIVPTEISGRKGAN